MMPAIPTPERLREFIAKHEEELRTLDPNSSQARSLRSLNEKYRKQLSPPKIGKPKPAPREKPNVPAWVAYAIVAGITVLILKLIY